LGCLRLPIRLQWAATLLALGVPLVGCAADQDVSSALKSRIESLASGDRLQVAGDAIAARRFLSDFYRSREFNPAWRSAQRQEQLLAVVEASARHGLDPRDYHPQAIRALRRDLAQVAGRAGEADRLADLDLLLSDALARLVYHLRFGKTDPRDLYPDWRFSRTLGLIDPIQAFETLIASEDLAEAVERYARQLPLYPRLREALMRYRAIEAAGGWRAISSGTPLKRGMRDVRVGALRARLAATDRLAAEQNAEAELFDEALESAVRGFQRQHGLEDDGVVGAATLKALNVPIAARIEQLRVNLERLRWVAQDLRDDYLLVDIAAFSARLVLNGKVVWTSRVVIGRPYRKTPAFRATMQSIVLNPSWVVPPTILREDVLPRLLKDPNYLQKNEMYVLDDVGRRVDPSNIDWARYRGAKFPYRIVQPPGPANPLGQIKFDFPNPYGVYLHDTPAKQLFQRRERAFSSGCIRLEQAHALAVLLLDIGDPRQWGMRALSALIASGETRKLPVILPVPVIALYLTVDVDEDGTIAFRPDLYGQDQKLASAMAEPFRFRPIDRPPAPRPAPYARTPSDSRARRSPSARS